MGVFGPGVGGGMLAAAGAVQGLGQGMVEVGKEQMKTNLAEKMNDLETKRQEAITRLQGSQASELEEQRSGHEEKRTQEEIAGRSSVAQFERGSVEKEAEEQRKFTGTQDKAKLESAEKRNERTAESRENVQFMRNQKSGAGANKIWQVHNVAEASSIDPVSHAIVPGKQTQILFNSQTRRQYVSLGDKYVPYDASKPGGFPSPDSIRRAPNADVQALLKDPLGKVPAGYPNAGMSNADAFERTHGYLPSSWASAAQQNDQQQSSSSTSLKIPGKWAPGMFKPGAQATPGPSFGGGGEASNEETQDDANADQDAAAAEPTE